MSCSNKTFGIKKCCCGFKQDRCFYTKIGECPEDYPNKYLNKNDIERL